MAPPLPLPPAVPTLHTPFSSLNVRPETNASEVFSKAAAEPGAGAQADGTPSDAAAAGSATAAAATAATGSKDVSVKVGNRWISSSAPAKKWSWAPFMSSSRADGTVFRHWVRANLEYHDYPYAKFDIHLDPVNYSDVEYDRFLKSEAWTKTETDKLMDLARRFDLRWPVIHDRWNGFVRSKNEAQQGADGSGKASTSASLSSRNVEDLQHRYYGVAAIISQARISQEAVAEVKELSKVSSAASAAIVPTSAASNTAIESTTRAVMETAAAKALASTHPNFQPLISSVGTGSTNKFFDVTHERDRRARLNAMWKRSKKEEMEEVELRKELRMVEAQLRKLKKSGAHIVAAAATERPLGGDQLHPAGPTPAAAAATTTNTTASTAKEEGDKVQANSAEGGSGASNSILSSTAPTPTPGVPYLMSGRLVPPAIGATTGISKTMAYRMDSFLVEINAPLRPLPTKRTCDLFDSVRKDTIAILSLQKTLLQKESSLQSKRLKLSKLKGDAQVADEEFLLGIPPPAPAPPVTASAPVQKSKTARATKPKAVAPSGKKAAATNKPKAEDNPGQDPTSGGAAGTKKAKTATKRKRKSETKTPSSGASVASAATTTTATATPDVAASQAPTASVAVPDASASVSEPKQPGGKKRMRKA